MKSLLNQLENDEAILLMYVADELPASDRAEVDRRLTAEPALQEQLDSIRGLQDFTVSSLREIDGQRAAGHGAGTRQVVRTIQRWNAGRARERAAQPQKQAFRLHIPSWAYPLAAAAIIVVAFGLWARNVENRHSTESNNSVAWTGGDGGNIFDAPPPDPSSPVAEQYAKLEATLDDSAGLTQMDDQVNSLSDWGSPILPRDVVEQ